MTESYCYYISHLSITATDSRMAVRFRIIWAGSLSTSDKEDVVKLRE